MPTVRTVLLEEAKRERLDRLDRARRYGMAMGVRSAQQHKQRQQDVEDAINAEIMRKLQSQREVELAEKENIQAQNSLLRGEGTRMAQEHVAMLAARAREERDAWRSERALTAVRANVATNLKKVERSEAEIKAAEKAAAKEKSRIVEMERTRRVVQTSKSESAHAFLGVADLSQPASCVVAKISDASNQRSSDEAATVVIEAKKREELEKAQLARERRQEAVRRAASIISERKAAEEKARVAAEEERLLRQSMVEQALRTRDDQPSYDFQEQDARKAMHNMNRARREFEEVFLSGPWSLEQVKKFHVAPKQSSSAVTISSEATADTSSSLFAFQGGAVEGNDIFAPGSAQQLLQGTPVIGLTTDHLFAKLLLPVQDEAVGDDDPIDGPEPLHHAAPTPTPSPAMGSPPQETSNTSSLPGLPPLAPTSLNNSSYQDDDADEEQRALQARNTQFLQELSVFHRRLKEAQRATQSIREKASQDHNTESDDSSFQGDDEGNLSVSPMSTPEKLRSPQRPHIALSASPPPPTREAFKVVMTSEQLRSAIKKMKAFHEQLDMSSTSSEVPTSSEQPSSIPHLRF